MEVKTKKKISFSIQDASSLNLNSRFMPRSSEAVSKRNTTKENSLVELTKNFMKV